MARFPSRTRLTMQACLLGAVLMSSAPADAGWLDRSRGIGTGAQIYGQVSVFRSVKQNLDTLTGLFGDMLDAAVEGDGRKVGSVWSDIRDMPGKIVRDAFPVLGLAESASAALGGARERLDAARARIDRLVDKAGGIGSLASLAISRKEQPFHEWTAGILGDESLPAVVYAEIASIEEPPEPASDIGGRAAGVRREGSPETEAGSPETRERYEETLKRLDDLLAASSGVKHADGGYEARIEALDRRRAGFEAERRERVAAATAKQTREIADRAARNAGVPMAQTKGEPATIRARMEANADKSASKAKPSPKAEPTPKVLASAQAQDLGATNASSKCVQYKVVDDRVSDYRGKRTWVKGVIMTNNCSYTVRLKIRDSAPIGGPLCGDFNYSLSQLRSGENHKFSLYSTEGEIRIIWCAEARDKDHPDHRTCPTKIVSSDVGGQC